MIPSILPPVVAALLLCPFIPVEGQSYVGVQAEDYFSGSGGLNGSSPDTLNGHSVAWIAQGFGRNYVSPSYSSGHEVCCDYSANGTLVALLPITAGNVTTVTSTVYIDSSNAVIFGFNTGSGWTSSTVANAFGSYPYGSSNGLYLALYADGTGTLWAPGVSALSFPHASTFVATTGAGSTVGQNSISLSYDKVSGEATVAENGITVAAEYVGTSLSLNYAGFGEYYGRGWNNGTNDPNSFADFTVTSLAVPAAAPFAATSIWNTAIPANATYVPANLGTLGGIANDQEFLYQTSASDPFQYDYQPQGYQKPGINIWDSLLIPNEPNGCAAFLLPDGDTLRNYDEFYRTSLGSTAVGYWYGDFSLSGNGLGGGHSGGGMSVVGGSVRQGELESSAAIAHPLKIELDWAVLYKNTSATDFEQQTFRWPAQNSDENYANGGGGSVPGYGGTNSSVRMGSLLALPKNVSISSLGLSTNGAKLAQAFQTYGAYVVDTTGVNWQWSNGGYTMALCNEENASPNYFATDNGYYNTTQLYHDMAIIYPLLAAVESNGPQSSSYTQLTDADIGTTGAMGSAAYHGIYSTFNVAGSGSDIWNNADQFNFESQSATGNNVLVVAVTSMTNTDPWAKAGVMFRDTSAAGSIFVDLLATESNGIAFQWRSSTGGSPGNISLTSVGTPTATNPVWLKLVKSGTTYTGYSSADGYSWTSIGSTTVSFSQTTYLAGLAVTSHSSGNLNSTSFSNFCLGASAIPNASFESPNLGLGQYQYNPTGAGWTFAGSSGVQSNGSAFTSPGAPHGYQTAFLQGNGNLGSVSESITVPATGNYSVTFQAAQRTGQVQPIQVSIDGVNTGGALSLTSNNFQAYTTATVSVAAGTHTLKLSATSSSGDNSSFIDRIQLVAH